MKKLKKISIRLSLDELKQLKGGIAKDNINDTNGCTCFYKDYPSLANSNSAFGCECTCWRY